MPANMVAAVKSNNSDTKYLALSDHNTYSGCREFLDACYENDIEGFVCSEISGSHEKYPHIEFHFLTFLGREWNKDVMQRAGLFIPYFNKLIQIDTQNIFLFLEGLSRLDITLPFKELVKKTYQDFSELSVPDNYELIKPVSFGTVRKVLKEIDLNGSDLSLSDFEKSVWGKTGIKPLPTPFITEAYSIFKASRPAVILAHPCIYKWTVDEARPLIIEWMKEINLVGLEAHYAGKLYYEWKELADELGLAVSAGSDNHSAVYKGNCARSDLSTNVPVVEDDEIDIPALIASIAIKH